MGEINAVGSGSDPQDGPGIGAWKRFTSGDTNQQEQKCERSREIEKDIASAAAKSGGAD